MRTWRRQLWAVRFTTAMDRRGYLLFDGWHHRAAHDYYAGEPTRMLLFTTRQTARDWCQAKLATWGQRQDCLRHWRVRPVRVTETVKEGRSR